MKTIAFIGLLLLSSAGNAMQTAEEEKIVAEDRAAWASVQMIDQHYAKPPAGWTRVEDRDLHFAASFPCVPKKSVTKLVMYTCAVGHRSYSVVLMKGRFEQAVNMEYFLAGEAMQSRKSLLASFGPPVTASSVVRVTYAGAQGRQEIVASSRVQIESRTVFRPDLAIEMAIGAVPGKLPGDQSRFFNSLELGR